MLDFKTVRAELGQFNIGLHPQSRWTPDELDILTGRILRMLPDWDEPRFRKACDAHALRSKLPPSPADLVAAEKAREAAPYRELKALPAWDTDVDAQAARNIAGVQRILEKLGRDKRLQ